MGGRRAGKLQGGDVSKVFAIDTKDTEGGVSGGFVLGDDSATERRVSGLEGFLNARS
jgi:hypothetical protein